MAVAHGEHSCFACCRAGGGRQPLTPRFVRHLTQLSVPPPSDAAIKTILSTILGGFLADWSPDLRALCAPIVACAVEAYNRISAELLPTPDKSHYTFNLRDLSKFAQVGCCQDSLDLDCCTVSMMQSEVCFVQGRQGMLPCQHMPNSLGI